jgi:hypothetical protein
MPKKPAKRPGAGVTPDQLEWLITGENMLDGAGNKYGTGLWGMPFFSIDHARGVWEKQRDYIAGLEGKVVTDPYYWGFVRKEVYYENFVKTWGYKTFEKED